MSLGTIALAGRRARLDRQRQVFATAFAAVTAYPEYPFIVRRRDPAMEAEERVRISGALSAVQADMDVHRARLKRGSSAAWNRPKDRGAGRERLPSSAPGGRAFEHRPGWGERVQALIDVGLAISGRLDLVRIFPS